MCSIFEFLSDLFGIRYLIGFDQIKTNDLYFEKDSWFVVSELVVGIPWAEYKTWIIPQILYHRTKECEKSQTLKLPLDAYQSTFYVCLN